MESTSRWKRYGFRVLVAFFYAALIYFLYRYASGLSLHRLKDLQISGYLLLALVPALVFRFLFPVGWSILLESAGSRVPVTPRFIDIYATSWMGRYLPGKVGLAATRIMHARALGFSKSAVMIAILVELGVQMSITCGLCLIGFVVSDALPAPWTMDEFGWLLLLILVPAGFLIYHPAILNLWSGLVLKLLRKERSHFRFSSRVLVRFVSLHLVMQILYGLFGLLVVASILPELPGPVELIRTITTFSFSVVAGVIAVFAPAGLGVRESTQLLLLKPIYSGEMVLALIALHRALEFLADLLFYFLARVWRWKWKEADPV